MMVSGKGHAAIAEVLIQAGADVDKADNNNYTALMLLAGVSYCYRGGPHPGRG